MERPGPVDLGAVPVASLLSRSSFPPPGTAVTCAVSGGADSAALLVLAVAAGCGAAAVHVDHGLREASAAEAEIVAGLADRLGAAFRSERVVVGHGPNLEARARAARLAVLPADVLTGHTADDRAESMLMNLVRGAGPVGMGGMGRSARRPLLDLRRHETAALCDAVGFAPVQDPSNDDPRFQRNRVRHELLPLLAEIGGRDPVPVLVRQADLFADLAAALDGEAAALDPTEAADLAAAAPSVAGTAVQGWLRDAGVNGGYPVDRGAVERILAVARHDHVATEIAGGWRVARSGGRLSVTAPTPCKDADHG